MDNEPTQEGGVPVATAQPIPVAGKKSTAVVVLSIVVVVQTLVIIGLVGALVWTCSMGGMYFGMPSGDEEQAMMMADSMACDVGYYLGNHDVDGYMSLYDEDDEHVDIEEVRRDFERVSETATTSVEYMAEMYQTYKDKDTGDIIVVTTVSGMDFNTGNSRGGRLKIVVNADTEQLTGKEGRELEYLSMW